MYTIYYECSKPNGIVSGTVTFSTKGEAMTFSEGFKAMDHPSYSDNRKTLIIGEEGEVIEN